MASLSFFVNTTKKDPDSKVSIRIRLRDTTTNQHTATGVKVMRMYWEFDKAKKNYQNFNGVYFKDKDNIKSRLSDIENHLTNEMVGITNFPKGWLTDKVNRYLHPDKYRLIEKKKTMFEWMEDWANNSPNAYRVVRSYHITINSLKEFNPSLEWDDINLEFYDKYLQYLKRTELAKNTIADRIKVLKTLCNAALERKEHTNTDFKSKAFKKVTEESVSTYLNETEIKALYNLDLSKNPSLNKVRDIFLIGCWTGCRFSDLHKVTNDNIDGDFIKIKQQKTNKMVVIPLHPMVRTILDKHNGKLPDMISNQKFNGYLKELAVLGGIDGKISKTITRGGVRQIEILDKNQMISSHTARRSFATNLYKSGLPSITIMAMTGHSTESSFLKYIKVTEEEHAEIVMKHWRNKGVFLKVV